MVPYDHLRVQFLDTPVRDMLDQYVTGDNAKLYYSFAVVTSKRDHSLQGLIGYRDIFAALLGRV